MPPARAQKAREKTELRRKRINLIKLRQPFIFLLLLAGLLLINVVFSHLRAYNFLISEGVSDKYFENFQFAKIFYFYLYWPK